MQQLQLPPLSDGETYIGAIGDTSGDVYHLIRMCGNSVCPPLSRAIIESNFGHEKTWQDQERIYA